MTPSVAYGETLKKRRWNKALIALGSNVGNRGAYLRRALALLEKIEIAPRAAKKRLVQVLRVSSFYETAPVGPKQRNFINAACQIKTLLFPEELLSVLKAIERQLGRQRTKRWGPRTIDLDLLAMGSVICRSRKLTLPHPEIAKRRFVLEPLAEIAPRARFPGCSKTVLTLLRSLTAPDQKVRLWRSIRREK